VCIFNNKRRKLHSMSVFCTRIMCRSDRRDEGEHNIPCHSCPVLHTHLYLWLVPKPHYSARPKRFGSCGLSEAVSLPFASDLPRIRHRSELTVRDWKNAVQWLGNLYLTLAFHRLKNAIKNNNKWNKITTAFMASRNTEQRLHKVVWRSRTN